MSRCLRLCCVSQMGSAWRKSWKEINMIWDNLLNPQFVGPGRACWSENQSESAEEQSIPFQNFMSIECCHCLFNSPSENRRRASPHKRTVGIIHAMVLLRGRVWTPGARMEGKKEAQIDPILLTIPL